MIDCFSKGVLGQARRKKAEEEQWLGAIDGIDLTLPFLRTKQADAARLTHRPVVELGLPRPAVSGLRRRHRGAG